MPAKKNVLKTTIELTAKQRTFVDILVASWGKISKVEAAQRAGYKSNKAEGPTETASRLTSPSKNPHVCRYLEKRLQQELQKYEKDKLLDYKKYEDLGDRAAKAGQYTAAINALFRKGQMSGFFIDRKEIKHMGLEGMSREALEKRLSELERKIGEGKEIINVTPEKITARS
jgi:phage terminase small subunit